MYKTSARAWPCAVPAVEKMIPVPTPCQQIQSTLIRPNNVPQFLLRHPPTPPPFPSPPPAVVTPLPPFERTFLFTALVYTLAQHSLQNEGHAWTLGFPVSRSSSCLHHRNSVLQALLYSFSFCHLIAGGLMVFSAIQCFCLFEADDDTDTGQEKNMTICFIVPYWYS